MKVTNHPVQISRRHALRALALATMLGATLATPVFAKESYLSPGRPDAATLLPPPPADGSPEQAADLDQVRAAFHKRTPQEVDRANVTGTLAFTLFAPAIGPVFDLDQLPHTASLLKHVKKDIHDPITNAKDYFKRLRPYQVDTSLDSGKREPSFGYPSGHSACGTIYGSVLAELFPEKKDAIMAIAYEIGWDRVILGKHYLTDVRAGREFGQAIVREMMTDPEFQHDLAAAKKEVRKAMQH